MAWSVFIWCRGGRIEEGKWQWWKQYEGGMGKAKVKTWLHMASSFLKRKATRVIQVLMQAVPTLCVLGMLILLPRVCEPCLLPRCSPLHSLTHHALHLSHHSSLSFTVSCCFYRNLIKMKKKMVVGPNLILDYFNKIPKLRMIMSKFFHAPPRFI